MRIANKHWFLYFVIGLFLLDIVAIVFSGKGRDENIVTDFSKQYFISYDHKFEPTMAPPIKSQTSLIDLEKIILWNHLSFDLVQEDSLLRVTVPALQRQSTLFFKVSLADSINSMPVIRIRTEKIIGTPVNKLSHFRLFWTAQKDFTPEKYVPFPIGEEGVVYLFLGRKSKENPKEFVVRIDFPSGENEIIYEIKEISLLEVEKRYEQDFFPTEINYAAVLPPATQLMDEK